MKNTKKVTFCAIMSALATVIMLVSYFPYLTYAVPAVAGLCIMAVLVEIGPKWATLSYFSAAFLSFLFAETESKIMFILFFGFYPVLKSLIERINNPFVEWVLKILIFNISLIFAYFVLTELFMLPKEDFGMFAKYGAVILLALFNFVYLCYDFAVSRMSVFYIYKLHPKIERLLK